MPDAPHPRVVDAVQVAISDAARDILAGFDREHIPNNVALAICGVVAGLLLDRSDPAVRGEWIDAIQARANA